MKACPRGRLQRQSMRRVDHVLFDHLQGYRPRTRLPGSIGSRKRQGIELVRTDCLASLQREGRIGRRG